MIRLGRESCKNLFQHVKRHFLNDEIQVIGLGSGKTLAGLVRHMGNLSDKKSCRFIVSSLQIKLEAEHSELNIVDENQVMNIQVLFDGADQMDSEYHMIKGGGGALFREKILFRSEENSNIWRSPQSMSNKLNESVPIEVHPFARKSFIRKMIDLKSESSRLQTKNTGKRLPILYRKWKHYF